MSDRVFLIAEVGVNHDGSLDKARALIDIAAAAGADAVKFQIYSGKRLYSSKTPRFDYLQHLGDKTTQQILDCLLYTSPSPRDGLLSRMPSSA